MPIWRLMPVDPLDQDWELSSHRGPALVRAMSESTARDAAAAAFTVAPRFPVRRGIRVPPWTRPHLVRAELVDGSVYPEEGPVEVLEPSFGQDLPRRPAPREPRSSRARRVQ